MFHFGSPATSGVWRFLWGAWLVVLALSVQAEPVVFTDQQQRDIALEHPAQKVVMIPIPGAGMAISVDRNAQRLTAIHPSAKAAIEESLMGKMFPKSLALPTDAVGQGFMPNVETILQQQPDLVFQWGTMGEDVVAPLENAGLNVALMNYGKENDVIRWFEMMGQAFGQQERVASLLKWRADVRQDVATKMASVPLESKPRTLYFLRFQSQKRVAGPASYNDFSIGLAGGQNVVTGGNFKEVNVEQVLVWDPEVILLNNFETDLTPQDIYQHPILSATSAAIHKRVYKMPMGGARWDPPGQESPLMWMWLANILQPDVADYDLKTEMKQAYRRLYDYELTDADIADILQADANAGSAGYDGRAP
ncbi:ABC transporter substrate-binding protein [Thiomicrospira sp. S5]|uniref:ABC transporter substrate-binding protein n=1 Tax=Thiomicrospira sp. S5 TaxID=1803865 RepID=UPI000F8A0E5F|nr:ABC transporter substrate-binding protein [Thiomicrospira sp. S5]AZR82795.1 hypothetical protein AYJ59_11210 [Thiomicrospira sp. S5]